MKNDILEIIESDQSNLLILGKAGVGKSTLIQTLKSKLGQKCIIVCPTGIAAQNVSGQTIHSFFKIPSRLELKFPEITSCGQDLSNLLTSELKELNTIILDEISMVNQYVLESISQILMVATKNPSPFGGMRLILIGDLFQLPPVDKDKLIGNKIFFWNSISFQRANFKCIELTKVFRQEQTIENQKFIEILGRIRLYEATQEDLDFLNIRVSEVVDFSNKTILCSKNDTAISYNSRGLQKLSTEEFTFHAQVNGTWSKNDYPKEPLIILKVGAPVLFMRNDPNGKYKNGTRGTITEIFFDQQKVKVSLGNDEVLDIAYVTWGHPKFNKPLEGERTEIIEQFKHFPIILGYAITIHRCQGMTLDSIHLDLGTGAFAPGQLYVALSRLRNLEGLTLANTITLKDVLVSKEITVFYQNANPAKVEFSNPFLDEINQDKSYFENPISWGQHDLNEWKNQSKEMQNLHHLITIYIEVHSRNYHIWKFELSDIISFIYKDFLTDYNRTIALEAVFNLPIALYSYLSQRNETRNKLRKIGYNTDRLLDLRDRYKSNPFEEVTNYLEENNIAFRPSTLWAIHYQKANQELSKQLFKRGCDISKIQSIREDLGLKKIDYSEIIGHIVNSIDKLSDEEMTRLIPHAHHAFDEVLIDFEYYEEIVTRIVSDMNITDKTSLLEIKEKWLGAEDIDLNTLVLIAERKGLSLGKYTIERKQKIEQNELFKIQLLKLVEIKNYF